MAMIMPQPLISISWLKKAFAMRTLLPVGLFVHPRAQVFLPECIKRLWVRIIIEVLPGVLTLCKCCRIICWQQGITVRRSILI